MIEVVRNGYESRVECKNCHSELKYSSDDVRKGEQYLKGDYWITPYYIRCPVCGYEVQTGAETELTYEAEKRINSYQPTGSVNGMGMYD